MKRTWMRLTVLALFFVSIGVAHAQGQPPTTVSNLRGTSWQLVQFQSGDGTTLAPSDKAHYTIALQPDGRVSARIDCNRGSGTWKSTGNGQLELGPLALTRAMCPSAPLNDRIPRDWTYVRSYRLKDGHLFLALMADGGIYEFEPQNSDDSSAQASSILGLPATFSGTLPCADCPGILYQVNLLADHTYASRMTYRERNTHFDDRGTWHLQGDGKTLVLRAGRSGSTQNFILRDGDTLRQLDQAGNEINSKLNYDLKRSPTFTPLESGNQNVTTAALENTSWNLVQLRDAAINASAKNKPYFMLNANTRRVSGSGGCNRLMGSYTLNGERLTFGQMAGTMMACPEGMETERAFLQAMQQVNSWKIAGRHLDLFDADGKLIAGFEAQDEK